MGTEIKERIFLDGTEVTPSMIGRVIAEKEDTMPPLPRPPSELREAYEGIDNDKENKKTRMSDIDFNSRLNREQITQYSIVDFLVSMKFLPPKALQLTRQLKRVHVSLDGLGRVEKVDIARGERDHEQKKSIMGRISGMFGGQ